MGVFVLLLLVSLSLGTVLTLWTNAGRYVNAELDWAGFGSLTAWVSDVPDLNGLAGEIAPGEVYVSPSLISMFGVELGSEIVFPIARAGGDVSFTVKGFYEDPFMGSSMIGMKGFLICQADHDALAELIRSSGIDALARDGAMLHLFSDSELTPSGLNQTVNENTSLPACAEFVHSAQAIAGFMLILQNAFSGLLIAFVIVLLAAVLVVLSHSIGSTIESDYRDMGILKTVGFTSAALRRFHLFQYGAAILTGMGLGLLLTQRRKYFSACAVAVLLVFFASLVGRMDAFNPADHDLGVQTFGTLDEAEAEKLVLFFTGITDSYLLAMPDVAVNGVDYTANVIDQPERFHILEGRTCETDREIVLTEFVAAHLGLGIGDSVTVTGELGQ